MGSAWLHRVSLGWLALLVIAVALLASELRAGASADPGLPAAALAMPVQGTP